MRKYKSSYKTMDEAYTEMIGHLVPFARRHLSRRDDAVDVCHNAFEKAIIYNNKHPDRKISSFILFREVARACRRHNKKYNLEVPTDLTSQFYENNYGTFE